MSPDIISTTVRDYFAAICDMNADAWVNTFAEDAVSRDPVDAPAMNGHEEIRRFFEGIAGAFKEVKMTADHVFVTSRGAAVKWTGTGTGKNGRSVRFEGIDVFELNDAGKIQKVFAYWNPQELMMQLQP